MPRYQTKRFYVDAVQFDPAVLPLPKGVAESGGKFFWIDSMGSTLEITKGMYVVDLPEGKQMLQLPDTFDQYYEPVPEE